MKLGFKISFLNAFSPLAHHFFFVNSGVSFQGGDMGTQGNHPDFFLFKNPSHIWRLLMVRFMIIFLVIAFQKMLFF
jgi:hypothetical protein